jgi:hypothetical protein
MPEPNENTNTSYTLLVEYEVPGLWSWVGVPPWPPLVAVGTMKSVRRIISIPYVLAIRQ